MDKRALKWLQFELEDMVWTQAKQTEGDISFRDNKVEVLEYFIDQIKAELEYIKLNK
jgi:hypothetical protein